VKYTAPEIAYVCHAANRALQEIQADNGVTDVPVGPAWGEETDETREGVIAGVLGALDGADPEESLAGWIEHKRAHGWTYGPVKDAEAKTHPCLVDYDQLPEEHRVKDTLFLAVVDALGEVDEGDTAGMLAGRHPSVAAVARFLFDVNPNLPQPLAAISGMHRSLAGGLLAVLDDGPELTAALRKLLEAKDCAVRAALPA
jgi:hypothetical protein